MKHDRNNPGGNQQPGQQGQQGQQATGENDLRQRSGAFNEVSTKGQKNTANLEGEAELEQERKEALTERD